MRIAYFDCFSGASGDMILGALVDAGLPLSELQEQLKALKVGGFRLKRSRVMRGPIAATRMSVELIEHEHEHEHDHEDHHHHESRNLGDIERIIKKSSLPGAVKRDSLRIFQRLAEAEAKVHGKTIDEIHFHEVGAVDAIVDIVGAVVGLHALGIEQVLVSTIATGSGYVKCGHGLLPVPAPATANLLKGFDLERTDVKAELTTPTGAAILTTLGRRAETVPRFRVNKVGYGAGSRDNPLLPNVLRLIIGETAETPERDEVWVIETNIDDMSAQICGYLFEKLFAAGALDVYAAPIFMKKNRPGMLLRVIADEPAVPEMERILLSETTTFGLRRHKVWRTKLARRHVEAATRYGKLRVKVGEMGGRVQTVAPEYEDCRAAAERAGVPLKRVCQAAMDAARVLLDSETKQRTRRK
jgi:hypothetical protein